jgi:hypothetical protein
MKVINDPKIIANPKAKITPPRYMGFLLYLKKPSVIIAFGDSRKLFVVLFSFNVLLALRFMYNPKIKTNNPGMLKGKWMMILIGTMKCKIIASIMKKLK